MITEIPTAIFLIPYFLFLILFIFFGYFNIYHLQKYALNTLGTHAAILLFLVGSVLIFGATAIILGNYDWMAPLDLSGIKGLFTTHALIKPL